MPQNDFTDHLPFLSLNKQDKINLSCIACRQPAG